MKLKNSDARQDINKLQEVLEIEIDSFIFQMSTVITGSPYFREKWTCFSQLRFLHSKDTICNIFQDKQFIKDMIDSMSKDIENAYKFTEFYKDLDKKLAHKIDVNEVALRFQLSSLCKQNIHKIAQLYLIKQFNFIEYLSYALGHSRFSKYFDIVRLKKDIMQDNPDNRYGKNDDIHIQIYHLIDILNAFLKDYETLLIENCCHDINSLTDDSLEIIIENSMKIVLNNIYYNAKETMENYNLIV